ncbi:hypothetical protein JCM11251_002727 [Rhodosporidiobolus azoricus]
MHAPPRTLRIGSFNIRYDRASKYGGLLQPVDKILSAVSSSKGSTRGEGGKKDRWGEHPWHERRDKLVDQVLFSELDVVGFQEVLDGQYEDLKVLLGREEWGSVGVGRDDGKRAGEAVPIFYRRDRLSLLRSHHFWLSPTPSIPGSKGWDADSTRMATMAFFRLVSPSTSSSSTDEAEQADLVVVNTHWDHLGLVARTESARLILRQVADLTSPAPTPTTRRDPLVILLGDLNSVAEEEGYQVLTGRRYLPGGGGEGGSSDAEGKGENQVKSFYDARHELAKRGTKLEGVGAMSRRFGPLNTFTGFSPSDDPKVIDFILPYSNEAFLPPNASSDLSSTPKSNATISAGEGEGQDVVEKMRKRDGQTRWKVHRYGVVPNFFEDIGGKRGEEGEGEADGMLVSDHRLVVVGMEEVVV